MRPVDIKTINYRGNKASKRRRPFRAKTGLKILAGLAALVGLSYTLFFAPWLRVSAVEFQGVNENHRAGIRQVIDQALNKKKLGLDVERDILFVSGDQLKADLAAQFPFLKNVSIEKKYFHTIRVVGIERQAQGVWCFGSTELSASPICEYFDQGG